MKNGLDWRTKCARIEGGNFHMDNEYEIVFLISIIHRTMDRSAIRKARQARDTEDALRLFLLSMYNILS